MTVTDETRHALYGRLEEILGHDHATTLMSHLPPVGWADVATKANVDDAVNRLRGTMEVEFEKINTRFEQVEGRFEARFAKIDARFGQLEERIDRRFYEVRSDCHQLLLRWTFAFFTLGATFTGLILGLD
jgi:hypothetical protein